MAPRRFRDERQKLMKTEMYCIEERDEDEELEDELLLDEKDRRKKQKYGWAMFDDDLEEDENEFDN